jgi:hypothetical protein
MKRRFSQALIAPLFVLPLTAGAQVPVTAARDRAALLARPDPRLAANERLVHDFWREFHEAAHRTSSIRHDIEIGSRAKRRDAATTS